MENYYDNNNYPTQEEGIIIGDSVEQEEVINKNERNRERFLRVGKARTQKTAKCIQVLGRCSDTSLYEYTEEDVKKMFSYLQQELNKSKKKFLCSFTKKKEFMF